LLDDDSSGMRRMVLVDTPMDALRLIKAGVRFDHLNLGNMSANGKKIALTRSVALGEDSMSALKEILEKGIDVTVQSVPFEKPLKFCDLCDFSNLCVSSVDTV